MVTLISQSDHRLIVYCYNFSVLYVFEQFRPSLLCLLAIECSLRSFYINAESL